MTKSGSKLLPANRRQFISMCAAFVANATFFIRPAAAQQGCSVSGFDDFSAEMEEIYKDLYISDPRLTTEANIHLLVAVPVGLIALILYFINSDSEKKINEGVNEISGPPKKGPVKIKCNSGAAKCD
ncbi:hypothetical protein [Ruegeria atlantica]|uniref:hypothetical protein n=1 Tax=Ruegeria atlantica TaxID=81569 RepID=UPI00147B1963|nr:hypothetical protein [Ruegeria atlantica]